MGDPTLTTAEKSLSRLRDLFLGDFLEPSAVRNAVCAYVDHMKSQGAPVERIIIDIKRVAEVENGALSRALAAKDSDGQRRARQVTDDAVKWCIQHYYSTERS